MERKQFFAKKTTGGNRPETFAMTVTGYDTKAKPAVVMGTRLDNNEEVSVYLRDVEYTKSGSFKRSEIKDFAAPRKDRQHPGTVVGGTLLVQEGFNQGENKFGARWIQSLSHTPGEAEVFIGTVHVSHVKRGAKSAEHPDGRPWAMMTVMHDGNFAGMSPEVQDELNITVPFKVDNLAELEEATTDLVKAGLGVGVRISNAGGFDAMYVSRKRDVPVEQSIAEFMQEIGELKEQIESGEFNCEVIPYSTVWAGPKTTDFMVQNKVAASRVRQFNAEVEVNGKTYTNAMYRPAIVAVRLTEPDEETGKRAVFFSHFEPLLTRQPAPGLVSALCYAQTSVLSPEVPKPNAAKEQEAPAAAAGGFDAGDSDFGSFDNDGLGDDLVGAASDTSGHDIGEDIPEPTTAALAAPAGRRYAGRTAKA